MGKRERNIICFNLKALHILYVPEEYIRHILSQQCWAMKFVLRCRLYTEYTKSEREHIASCAIFPLRSRSRTEKKQTNLMHFMYIYTNKHTHSQREERQRAAMWSGNQRGWKRSERKNFKHLAFIKMNAQH